MSLYPSLEDMNVAKMAHAQVAAQGHHTAAAQPGAPYLPPAQSTTPGAAVVAVSSAGGVGLYPSLDDYMGLNITKYQPPPQAGAMVPAPSGAVVVSSAAAPTSGPVSGVANVGIRRAQIKQGVHEVTLCKDAKGKCGVSLHPVNKGVFVCFIQKDSPAALSGLRFGDQILSINGEFVAGYSEDKINKVFRKAPADKIVLAIRERPFERTITMQKDSANHVGFAFKDGQIKQIVKDSSAARNGLLTDHYLTEVNGQNVIGLKDKDIGSVFSASPRTITITIMPAFVYDHMMKNLGSSLKKKMDHSIPDV